MTDYEVGQLLERARKIESAESHLRNSGAMLTQAQISHDKATSNYNEARQNLHAFVLGVNEDV
jgi:hypothetical protein